MRIHTQKITIVRIQRHKDDTLNEQLQWFGQALGLFNARDREGSCFRVFIELLKAAKYRQPMSSDDIAFRLDLSRGTVVHHINKLMESGLVITHGRGYMLRVNSLDMLVDEIKNDVDRTLTTLKDVAQRLDEHLGL